LHVLGGPLDVDVAARQRTTEAVILILLACGVAGIGGADEIGADRLVHGSPGTAVEFVSEIDPKLALQCQAVIRSSKILSLCLTIMIVHA
jgi:hypothetical protein